jgi:hypothetical protein
MRRFVHDFLKWFPPAVGGGGLAVAAVWEKARDWIASEVTWAWLQMSNPWIAFFVIVAVVAYVGAILWTGQERKPTVSLSAPPIGPDQLYLFKNPAYDDLTRKSYLIVWSPIEYFSLVFADYDSRSRSWPPSEPVEKCLTFYLHNPGPDDLRHLKIEWDLGDLDIEGRIRSTGLFDGYIDKLIDVRLELYNEGVGWIGRPFNTRELVEIPLVKAGETLAMKAPEAINWGFALYALTEAKRISATPVAKATGSLRDWLIAIQADIVPFEPIIVTIGYVGEDMIPRTQTFGVTGEIMGRVATPSQKPDVGTENTYSTSPDGITAAIDHIQIYRA